MDNNLTDRLQSWLESPEDTRDYSSGNELLLKFSGNRIRFRNIAFDPERYKDVINHELDKYLQYRLQRITHEQYEALALEARIAYAANFGREKSSDNSKMWKGKRSDHDSLPENIRQLYSDIPFLRQEMRRVHTKLESMSTADMVCPDSDRLPYVTELISLNKKIRQKWELYDSYDPEDPDSAPEETESEKERKARSAINLNKNRYRKNPAPELKDKICGWYAVLKHPAEKMTAELRELGIIE